MPNHIINTIRLTGDREKISELLESVKDNRFGIGSLDFNKVIPMPESLQIETSSSMLLTQWFVGMDMDTVKIQLVYLQSKKLTIGAQG